MIIDFMDEVVKKQNSQKDLKLIFDKLEESIIIINDNEVEFVNDKFLTCTQEHLVKYQLS